VAEEQAGVEPFEPIAREWLEAMRERTGALARVDAHTHIGRNDPDGFRQEPDELIGALERADARAVCFPMHEPGGYTQANDEAIAAAGASDGRLFAFCRVDPDHDALAEARRCLAAGARGIKLHPRAEGFTLDHPAIEPLVALAGERRVPVLIHAGRGIPALGHDALALATRYPDAQLILAHGAVSDLAWLWRLLPEHPNVLIDTSWWNPADLIALFCLVAPGQILWASDSPYGQPLLSAALHLRCALTAGLEHEALASIAGAQLERILAGERAVDAGPAPGSPRVALDIGLERVASHVLTAIGFARAGGDPSEQIALARLACDREGAFAAVATEVDRVLELAELHHAEPPPPGRRFRRSMQFLIAALCLARTPEAGLRSG
jgi:predicted TIM-barrel fold metal-dependent hydrolase